MLTGEDLQAVLLTIKLASTVTGLLLVIGTPIAVVAGTHQVSA